LQGVFKTKGHVFIYAGSGTAAWEAGLTNALSPGDKVLMFETGHFSALWKAMAAKLGFEVDYIESDWRSGIDPEVVAAKLRADSGHAIKAVCLVHNETSTGVTSPIGEVRKLMDAAKHPALLMVDTVSSLASIDYRHDDWAVDVAVGSSQKGLMLPPGLGFNAVSEKAMKAAKEAKMPNAFFNWHDMANFNAQGYFPYTPATSLLYGLAEAIDMLGEEGLDAVFARHERHGEAVRRAVRAWGLEILCRDPKCYSPVVTTVMMPEGRDADGFRKLVLQHFDMALGSGLSKIAGKVFRIGHIGDTNDLTILGALAGVEMSLSLAGIAHKKGGVDAAMAYLADAARAPARAAAE
jgi:alanine-glyoxylate transaminase/serine-glyoxylate transaminase/serine-pyruvate transaminase